MLFYDGDADADTNRLTVAYASTYKLSWGHICIQKIALKIVLISLFKSKLKMSPKNGLVFKKIRGGWVQPIVKNFSFF